MTAMATPRHRVSAAIAHAHAALDAVADSSVWSMTPEEATATLVEITRVQARTAELEARVAEHADDETVDAWAHRTTQIRAASVVAGPRASVVPDPRRSSASDPGVAPFSR